MFVLTVARIIDFLNTLFYEESNKYLYGHNLLHYCGIPFLLHPLAISWLHSWDHGHTDPRTFYLPGHHINCFRSGGADPTGGEKTCPMRIYHWLKVREIGDKLADCMYLSRWPIHWICPSRLSTCHFTYRLYFLSFCFLYTVGQSLRRLGLP